MENAELIKALKEDAEWAHANEWETPITLGDHLDAAADRLEAADKREEAQRWIPVGERLPMNADEIARAPRTNDLWPQVIVEGKEVDANRAAADLIESLQAQLAESQRREWAARNELCLKCGLYHDAHKGACDGCRWKEK